jgi:undecaprenyl-diphosphatase
MNGMTFFHALFLGILQGLTEFLPVSSSGHLVLLQQLFGLHEPALVFDIFVHVATLGVVLILYRQDVWMLIAAWLGPIVPCAALRQEGERAAARRLGLLVLLANVPTALCGILFAPVFERLFATPWAVGIALCVTGLILWRLRVVAISEGEVARLGVGQALLLGCVQGLAIVPGISRSGSTIATALFCGTPRALAARFSFLMAVPAIFGAALLKASALSTLSAGHVGLLLTGMLSAFVVGYLALRLLLHVVTQGTLWRFALYCWLVGGSAITLTLLR